MIAYITWNPDRVAFTIPYFIFDIYWYSIFFAIGFYGAIVIARYLIKARAKSFSTFDQAQIDSYIDWLTFYCFIGVIVGARLGHVLFYDLAHHLAQPLDIFNLRLGGLASHGGIIGLLIALWFFSKKKGYTAPYFPRRYDLFDLLSVASAWLAGCIRIGNFFNQEIVGLQTTVPWAVRFISPLDASGGIPRHPTQLYEAFVAFSLLILLLFITRGKKWATGGRLTGWYLLLTFSFRYLIEQYKVPQCTFDAHAMHMGQLLSIPLILIALYLIFRPHVAKSKEQSEHHHESR